MQELKPSLKVQSDSICTKLIYKEIYIKMKYTRMQSNLFKLI